MDLEDLFSGKHRQPDGWRAHQGSERYPDRRQVPRRAHPTVALLRAVVARPSLLVAFAVVLLAAMAGAISVSVLVLGYVGEHGVKGVVEAVLGLGSRLWEGRG